MANYIIDDVVQATRPALPRRYINFKHPFHDSTILRLIKNVPAAIPTDLGVCFSVALEACKITAYNRAGYLSTSIERREGRVAAPADNSDVVLTSRDYYYHLDEDQPLNYPICVDFDTWRFPHKRIPQSWSIPAETSEKLRDQVAPTGSMISQLIKVRDEGCRVTKWRDDLSTAHIIPKTHREWMQREEMDLYSLGTSRTLCDDTRNQFAMRSDIHLWQLDAGKAVIVPITGHFCFYFLDAGMEAEQLYHRRPFDTIDLAHEYLYARFAWAVIKSANDEYQNLSISKKKSVKTLEREEEEEGQPPANRPKTGTKSKGPPARRSERHLQASGSKSTGRRSNRKTRKEDKQAARDAKELAEDMQKAEIGASFFLTPDSQADPYHYEQMMWYPGRRSIERLKQNYIDSHPNVCAHSIPSVDGLSDVDDPCPTD